ncbi:CinA family protein [Spiroplasma taiwanense]|uniref:Competence damage-inducible protein A n=1 Tax=Spiroplasma taiwanense CT-1 TaxID=1276220 RepID=S5MB16_9MOLU|nr:nicotinamide-nucleotide amidohydrolase family protein [Spiroplasma taiwanense]AGR40963.1 competence damage-inducible protein A [Spiroplasma taiwanense CT-1]
MRKLLKKLLQKKYTISACESFSGGMFSNEITNIKGSSDWFMGSFVCYSNDFKNNILNIDIEIIKKYSAVSFQAINLMLDNTFKLLNTEVVFAFTGYATPIDITNGNSGLSYIGFRFENKNHIYKFEIKKNISRKRYKKMAIKFIIKKFLYK